MAAKTITIDGVQYVQFAEETRVTGAPTQVAAAADRLRNGLFWVFLGLICLIISYLSILGLLVQFSVFSFISDVRLGAAGALVSAFGTVTAALEAIKIFIIDFFFRAVVDFVLGGDRLTLSLALISVMMFFLSLTYLVMIQSVKLWRELGMYSPERAVRGSIRLPCFKKPSFQASVCVDGVKYGQCFRADAAGMDVLITAAHVVEIAENLEIRNGSSVVAISHSDFTILPHLDVAFAPFSAQLTKLGLTKAKLRDATEVAIASITDGESTTSGLLKPFDFGTITYGATTWNGCSGAPYYCANTVYGMHLGGYVGSGINTGRDGSFLALAIKFGLPGDVAMPETVESSEDIIERLLSQGEQMEWKHTGDPDVIVVNRKGKYTAIETDTPVGRRVLNRLQKKNLEFHTEAVIPEKELPQIEVGEDSSRFLGERIKLKESPTLETILPTPTTSNSDMNGHQKEKTDCGNPSTSTRKSRTPTKKNQQRLSAIKRLMLCYPNMQPGDQQLAELFCVTPPSTTILEAFIQRQYLDSTGPPQ